MDVATCIYELEVICGKVSDEMDVVHGKVSTRP